MEKTMSKHTRDELDALFQLIDITDWKTMSIEEFVESFNISELETINPA